LKKNRSECVTWIHDAIAEFGRKLGVQQLGLGSHGAAQLAFEDGGFLTVEPVQRGGKDEVLVYMGRLVGHQAALAARTALAKAHVASGGPFQVQVSLRGKGVDAVLIAAVRVPDRAFTPQALTHSVDYLSRWLDEVQAGNR
jgi:type III secretion system chaperone SycN